MNDQPDTNTQPVAFCQNCGKSLDSQTVRKVGTAVYCEPCLAAKIAGQPAGSARPYSNVYGGGSTNGQPIFNGSEPNPGLAALLGLIPGVGAMYNEQYAKGVVHLVIFAVLVMFSHVSGIFGLFVMGWICYMSIEAHHTAKARRDGTPLPNPFGFNDIGERMGFGSAWPAANPAAAARDAVNTAAEHINAATAGFNRPPIVTPPPTQPGQPTPAAPWGAPTDAYTYANPYTNPPQPYASPYTTAPYTTVSGVVPPNVVPPNVVPPNVVPPFVPPPSRFPTGAVILIGLGMLFLLGTMGIFNSIPGFSLVGVILLALGVWIFLRRMTETGLTLTDDGSSNYQFRVFRALKGAIWLIALGILVLLEAFRLIRWEYTWPSLIILAGVMMIIQRTIYNHAAVAAYHSGPIIPPAPTNPTVTPTESDTHEGGN